MNSIKEIFQTNLKRLLKENNKTQLDLAKAIGVSNTTINNYVKGYNTPRMDKVDKICKYFRINRSDLIGHNEDLIEEKTKPHPKGIKIPVLGVVPAGIPIEAIEDIIDYEEIPYSWKNQGEFFGLRISGDSMLPDITDNDIVIVRQQSTADNGDTVIALVNGDDATCKRLQRQTNGIMLIPNNSSYPTYFYSNEEIENLPVKIVGKVVELRRKF
ncbi:MULTISPECIES: LexA family protein [Gemella]|nr:MULTISPECIES: XRE family transcriptional regulator [Gemella]